MCEAIFVSSRLADYQRLTTKAEDYLGVHDACIRARMNRLALKAASSGHRLRIFDVIKTNVGKFSKLIADEQVGFHGWGGLNGYR